MHKIWILTVISGVLLTGCGATHRVNQSQQSADKINQVKTTSQAQIRNRQEIRQVNRQQNYGMVHKDVKLLRRITAKGAKFIHMDGIVQSRDGWIDSVKTGSMTYYSGKTKSMTIHLQGNHAKVIVHNEVTARINGIRGTWTLRSENNLRKIKGQWKITRSQSYSE